MLPKLRTHSARLHLALLAALLLLLLGLFLRTELRLTGNRLGVPLDDAWIHYQFARNLAQGHGFSYNPGEPTPGSTAPLWTLLLAAAGLFTTDFVPVSLAFSAFFLLLTAALAYGFTRDLLGAGGNLWAFFAALGVILTGRLLWAGLAGMETTAFAACSLAAVWAYHRHGLRPLPTLLFALAAQLRPEGHALFALALADTLWQQRQDLRAGARSLLIALSLYGLVAAPYMLFSMFTTGHPLPNTFYAKASSEHLFSLRTLRETLAYHWQDNPVAFLLIPFGLLPAWKRSRLLVAWLLGLPLFTAVIVAFTWHHGRYTLPLIPFQMIVAALGAALVAAWLVRHAPRSRRWLAATRLLPALLLLLLVAGGSYRLPYWAGMLGYNSNEILEIDVAMGRWLAANTPADALLAVDDIGAITFLSQRRIFDLNGLVSPEMWPIIRGEPEGLARSQATTRLLSVVRPDYLAIFPLWHWDIATNNLVATPVATFAVDSHTIVFAQDAAVYGATWPYLPTADPQVPLVTTLADAIRLRGYDFTPPTPAGQPLVITLYWQSLAPVADSYDVFLHLLDDSGNIVAQIDRQPVAGLAPTDRWLPGDIVRDPYTLPLPAGLPAGTYHLNAGLYQRASSARLPLTNPAGGGDTIPLRSFAWQP